MTEIKENLSNQPNEDDGSLACLNLPQDPDNKFFNCRETNQSRLQNTTFYVIDFHQAKTKYSEDTKKPKYVVKIKEQLEMPESQAQKFFTGSKEIIYVLDKLRELNKLPRRVTLRGNGLKYWFE